MALLDVIGYVEPVNNVVPGVILGAHEAEIAQLEVIGYVDAVNSVVAPEPAFRAYEAVIATFALSDCDAQLELNELEAKFEIAEKIDSLAHDAEVILTKDDVTLLKMNTEQVSAHEALRLREAKEDDTEKILDVTTEAVVTYVLKSLNTLPSAFTKKDPVNSTKFW